MSDMKMMFEYEKLKAAVRDYLSEVDNPVADALFRHMLRNKLRQMVGAPEEPKSR